jgi:hypothetical protein
MALDLILMGPGFGFYNVKAKVGTNGYERVNEAGEFSKKGTYNTEGVGFRYLVRISYRF